MYGGKHNIQAIGMSSLTGVSPAPEVQKLIKLFPGDEQSTIQAFNRALDKVQLMIWMTSRSLHCKNVLTAQELRLKKSIFYPRWVLTGYLPGFCEASTRLPAEVLSVAVQRAMTCGEEETKMFHQAAISPESARSQVRHQVTNRKDMSITAMPTDNSAHGAAPKRRQHSYASAGLHLKQVDNKFRCQEHKAARAEEAGD